MWELWSLRWFDPTNIIYGGSSLQRRILFNSSLVQQAQLTYKWIIQVDNGFLEAIVRGYKAGILSQNQYANLSQCETLEGTHILVLALAVSILRSFFSLPPDFRTQLSATDYGNFLANEPLPISTSTISDKATLILVEQFNYLRNNAVQPLAKFLEYITSGFLSFQLIIKICLAKWARISSYAYMIDNVVLLITGTLHERDTHELLERCHPLGVFDTMPALCVATNVEELYQSVLVETPLGAQQLTLSYRTIYLNHIYSFSTLLPRLPFCSRSRRTEYRTHP